MTQKARMSMTQGRLNKEKGQKHSVSMSRLAVKHVRVVKTVVLKMTIYILPTKTRGCGPQSPEADENDENPSAKTRVCQEHRF